MDSGNVSGEHLNSNRKLNHRSQLVASAAKIALGTGLSRMLGLLRDMLIARYFVPETRDAFVVAFRLPNFFRRIFSEGAITVSFTPIFVQNLPDRERAKALWSSVFTIVASISVLLSSIFVAFMPEILQVILPGEEYLSVPGKFEATVYLARIMISSIISFAIFAYMTAVLASLRKFLLAALAPCLFNLVVVLVAWFRPKWGPQEPMLAWAVIAGSVLQVLIVLPALWREGYFPRLRFKLDEEVWRVLQGIIPGILGLGLMQMTMIANIYFASYLPQGSHTFLYLADRLLELPLALFVISVGSALLPELSHHWARGEKKKLSEAVNSAIRLIAALALPAAIGLFLMANPICQVLFVGKQFTVADADQTAVILRICAMTLLSASAVRVLSQGFYAIETVWFPVLAAVVAFIAHIIFAFSFMKAFGLSGLALATSASSLVNLLLLLIAYHSWIGKIEWRALGRTLWKCAPAFAFLFLWIFLYDSYFQYWTNPVLKRSIILILTVGLGGAGYVFIAGVFGSDELKHLLSRMKSKLK